MTRTNKRVVGLIGGAFAAPNIAHLRGSLRQGAPTTAGRKSRRTVTAVVHWSDPQPVPKPVWQGARFNDYVAVARALKAPAKM